MITKIAANLLQENPSVRKMLTHPLALGFTAFDVASGTSSLPQSLGGATVGAHAFNLGSRVGDTGMNYLANKLSSGLSKNPKFAAIGNFIRLSQKGKLNPFPKLRGVGRFVSGSLFSEPGYRVGRRMGEAVPGFKHQPSTS